jgi:hypothetical protein
LGATGADAPRRASGAGSASDISGPKVNEKAWLARIWADFDVKYMKPFLTHARPTLLDTLPVCCNPLARILTTTEQLTQVTDYRTHSTFRDIDKFYLKNSSNNTIVSHFTFD